MVQISRYFAITIRLEPRVKCGGEDLNPRTHKGMDLKSIAFDQTLLPPRGRLPRFELGLREPQSLVLPDYTTAAIGKSVDDDLINVIKILITLFAMGVSSHTHLLR